MSNGHMGKEIKKGKPSESLPAALPRHPHQSRFGPPPIRAGLGLVGKGSHCVTWTPSAFGLVGKGLIV